MNAIVKNLKDYFGEFGKLWQQPRAFHGVQIVGLINAFTYFVFTIMGTLYLTQDMGIDDVTAGFLYMIFVSGIALINMPSGLILDHLGFRRTTYAAGITGLIGQLSIGLAPLLFGKSTIGIALLSWGLVISAFSYGLFFPIVSGGTQKYSSADARGVAFNYYYLLMQLGAIGSGFWIDAFRQPHGGNSVTYVVIGVLAIVPLITAWFLIKNDASSDESGKKDAKSQPSFWEAGKAVVTQRTFWMMILFLMLILGARMSFVYPLVVYPKYYTRVLGSDVNLGALENLNPEIILIGIILFAPLLSRYNQYWRMFLGMVIASVSGFFLAIPPHWLAEVLGSTIDRAYYVMVLLQIAMFAVGELIWSPVMQQFMLSFAPKDQEGAYAGFAMLPSIASKAIAAGFSGYMLARWCPDGIRDSILKGPVPYGDSPEMMNLVLGFICLSSPILFLCVKRWYYQPTPKMVPAAVAQAETTSS